MQTRVSVPAFREALSKNLSAMIGMPLMTQWRYANGVLPKVLQWLFQHPDLLRALAEDAEQHRRSIEQPAHDAD
jgi:hypothetical protein